ncbi:MAG: replication initiation protein [Lachnospiraceae bacterium]|nr:replication initiation protein [Lachnospiraceae bacterium]
MENRIAATTYDADLGTYRKSNYLIKAKYKMSLTSEKLFAISLSRLRENFENGGKMSVTITKSELRKLLAKQDKDGNSVIDDGNIYRQLLEAANSLHLLAIYIQNDSKKHFHIENIYHTINYNDSDLYFEFNPNIRNYVIELKDNFTVLNLPTMLRFTRNYSYRLYEILKSKCYYPRYVPIEQRTDKFQFRLDLLELKFTIGVLDAKDEKVIKLFNSENPTMDTYKKAYDILKKDDEGKTKDRKVKYDTWKDFKTRVLDPSVEEINEKTDIHVEYILGKGARGRVVDIEFHVDLLKDIPVLELKKKTAEEIEDFLDDMRMIMPLVIKTKDLKAIAEASDYNIDKIKNAVKLYQNAGNIENVVGFLISAIKENYTKISRTKKWEVFEKQDYGDMDEFENLILANNVQMKLSDVE